MSEDNIKLPKNTWNIGQDWASVLIGFALVFFVILYGLFIEKSVGHSITAPTFGGKTGWNDFEGIIGIFNSPMGLTLISTLLIFGVFSAFGVMLSGESLKNFLTGFITVCMLAFIALFVSSYARFKNAGLETVLFSLLIGLLLGNLFKLPAWLKAGVLTELYVKIGLVLLGATILFKDILQAGAFGMIQAVIVVFGVWYFAFWISKKLKVDDEYSTMLASAVSICGVSAAIATAGAINGDKKKLSFIISLVLIVAIPMMIFMPVIARWIGLSDTVTGAWLGGTIDTTGAVVAAGTIAGETGLKYATIVKFSQNVLLGLAAFIISVFWAYRKKGNGARERVSLGVIWERFPKFVLGFILASVVFSFFLNPETATASGKVIKSFSSFWFNLAFISIGLETRFSDLKAMESKKPFYAFLIAQGFNIIFTLIVSYLLFQLLSAS
jgi:uncharacterized integral membrane protein (TIGR00698 family)